MTIIQLYNSPESPLSDEQKEELRKEYFQLREDIDKLRKEEETLKDSCESITRDAVGCIDAVKAMLQYGMSDGFTHRQKDFHRDSMIKYIEKVRKELRPYFNEPEDDIPF